MSEFKFACPVCGQHITADSSNTGSQLECPTCFRKIVVPQAPASPDSKYILAAAEVNKPRPRTNTPALEPIKRAPEKTSVTIILAALVVIFCAAGATLYAFREKIFVRVTGTATGNSGETNGEETAQNEAPPALSQGPSNSIAWTLDLSGTTFPETAPAGKIRDEYVLCNRVTLTGGALGLRQLTRGLSDLSVTIYFFAKQPEELRGQKISVTTNDLRAPKVVVRWKELNKTRSTTFTNGYALKIELGDIAGNHIPGKIYLSLPDQAQTRVAGAFRAELKKPAPPKPKSKSTS